MKWWMAGGSLALAMLLALAGYVVPNPYWQALLVGSATSFLALGVGVVFVNIYLERSVRQGAVRSLLVLANDAIAKFHNHLLGVCMAKFGRDEWLRVFQDYVQSNGDPRAVRADARRFLYDSHQSDAALRANLDGLEEMLTELARLVGWDLDAKLLEACLDARISIRRLKVIEPDGSQESIDQAAEHLMDAEIHTQTARGLLLRIAGDSGLTTR